MDWSKRSTAKLIGLSVSTLGMGLVASSALAQGTVCPPNCAAVGGEQKQMIRKAHIPMQGREAYQPNVIQHPNGKWLLFVGTHTGTHPNTLKAGQPSEPNGTMIVDVTNVNGPIELAHIAGRPGGAATGPNQQSQMVRMCKGRDMPPIAGLSAGVQNQKLYLMRNISAGYETYDVTNPSAPVFLASTADMGPTPGSGTLEVTHKMWWECSTGLVYAPGSRTVDGFRQEQSMLVMDWKNPTKTPNLIRTFTLPGGQSLPVGTGPVPTSLHGPISTYEHPDGANKLVRGATASDIIRNRIYLAWGVGDDGVMQILDRQKLLPPNSTGGNQAPVISYGGSWDGSGSGKIPELGAASIPTNDQLLLPQVGVLNMSPDQGGHTSMPFFGMEPPSYQSYSDPSFLKRDIEVLSSEATSNLCVEPPHWTFLVDVSVENSITAPPGTRVEQDKWQGPMVLSTLSVDPRAGQAYSRGNYCTRGSRFGTHSTEENFGNPYYGRCTFIALFTGGVRAWDIQEPQAPKEVAFFVPGDAAYPNYMTNNLEVDDRGNIYAADRVGAGAEILQLSGAAKNTCLGM